MRSQESNYMYSSFTKSTINNQNTQLTEKSVGITIWIFPDYPIEKSQYPINKKISGYYPIHQNFLSGALNISSEITDRTKTELPSDRGILIQKEPFLLLEGKSVF